jgi:hypothetical protein
MVPCNAGPDSLKNALKTAIAPADDVHADNGCGDAESRRAPW